MIWQWNYFTFTKECNSYFNQRRWKPVQHLPTVVSISVPSGPMIPNLCQPTYHHCDEVRATSATWSAIFIQQFTPFFSRLEKVPAALSNTTVKPEPLTVISLSFWDKFTGSTAVFGLGTIVSTGSINCSEAISNPFFAHIWSLPERKKSGGNTPHHLFLKFYKELLAVLLFRG